MDGIFIGWVTDKNFGFIKVADEYGDIFLHENDIPPNTSIEPGDALSFDVIKTHKGRAANNITIQRKIAPQKKQSNIPDEYDDIIIDDDIEELDTSQVDNNLLLEIANWKREAKAEDSNRYFWHVKEVDQISQGNKYFIIGRKGCGKTAICEYFNKINKHNVFSEKLSFKQFPFNDLYSHKNESFTAPNQYITIWKYLIYNTICRSMLRNEAIDGGLRNKLSELFDDNISLSRRVKKWVGKEFGISLFGLSVKVTKNQSGKRSDNWVDYVDYVEDLLRNHVGDAVYYVLFDELDEDYRDIINADQHHQYTALITSLFKAVQDIRTIFDPNNGARLYPVIFLRDDIYSIIQDSDKNKWGDFKVDLDWDSHKIKKLIAFRISRASALHPDNILPFEKAWGLVFGRKPIGIGTRKKRKISTFDFILRSTLVRPRDFVVYLQSCAEHATTHSTSKSISPRIVKIVDKAFSNYLREELTDELFAVLPDITNIFDTISQLRKWIFSISEFEKAYMLQVDQGFIKEKNVKFVLQILYMFDVIGNTPRPGRTVFRYQNREARLNFNERVVVHRGLFKALQII